MFIITENSIIAEEPLIVCMIRNISLMWSSVKSLSCSAEIKISSSWASNEFVSNRYISNIESIPLSINLHRLVFSNLLVI